MEACADRRTNGGGLMEWARILAYITGTVDQELLLRNEYLAAENRILRGQLKGRLKLSDAERAKLGEIGRRLGRKALGEVANAALPDTILAWYRRIVARKFDGSKHRSPGRPRVDKTIEGLIVRMAEENLSWGYDRIVGALANLGHEVSDQTVGNVLQRHGLPPAPERKHTTTNAAGPRIPDFTWPAIRSVTACPAPRYGTCSSLIPASFANHAPITCWVAGVTGFNQDRGDQLTIDTLPFENTLLLEPPDAVAPRPAAPAPPGGFVLKWDRKTMMMGGGVLAGVLVLVFLLLGQATLTQ